MSEIIDKPWYRHFWVWFVLAPLIATVIGSAITLYLAGSGPEIVADPVGQTGTAQESAGAH